MTTAGERLEAGLGLAARGNLQGAREAIEAQLDPLDARAHELLCVVCRALEDIDAGRRYGEVAYRLHRDAGNLPRAAFAAVQLAKLADFAGYEAARRGWMGRAARMLAQAGPCVEEGYYDLGQVGCDVADVTVLERSATAALAIARSFNDADLEVRALADAGLALVSQGRIEEGLAYLDEAMAAIVAGEVRSVEVAGMSCCAMLSACDRLGDLDRAMEWKDAILISMRDRFGDPPPPVLQAHCRVVYGGLLAQAGQWAEAEAELRHADQQTRRVSHRSDACARLADLRIRQGRPAEAAELLRGWEDRVPAAGPLARLHLARGETDLAAATVAGALRQVGGDVLTSAPLLALQVEIAVRAGDLPTARAATEILEHAASSSSRIPGLAPLSHLCAARTAAAGGQDPVEHLQAGLAALADQQRPPLCAELHLELSAALASGDQAAAITEARAALAIFQRLGFRSDSDRAAAMLRTLGVAVRAGGAGRDPTEQLSRRERDVLPLLAEGLSNAEIGKRLYISAKTAEHHVGAILAKLGLRSRAEAAAYAAGLPSAPA